MAGQNTYLLDLREVVLASTGLLASITTSTNNSGLCEASLSRSKIVDRIESTTRLMDLHREQAVLLFSTYESNR